MEFLRSLLRRRFARAQVAISRSVGCFLRLVRCNLIYQKRRFWGCLSSTYSSRSNFKTSTFELTRIFTVTHVSCLFNLSFVTGKYMAFRTYFLQNIKLYVLLHFKAKLARNHFIFLSCSRRAKGL